MKFLFKILGILIVLFILVSVAIYITATWWVSSRGKYTAEKILSSSLGRPVAIEEIRYLYPLSFLIEDVRTEDLSIDSIKVDVAPLELLVKIAKLNVKIQNLEFTYHKDQYNFKKEEPAPETGGPPVADEKKEEFRLIISRLEIRGGKIRQVYSSEKIPSVTIADIDADIRNITFPLKERVNFKLSADFISGEFLSDEGLHLEGWMDLQGKNMDAQLEVSDVDFFYFKHMLPAKSRLFIPDFDRAVIDLSTHFLSENDELTIDSFLILKEFIISASADESRASLFSSLISPFRMEKDKYKFNFTLVTKMSRFKLDLASIGRQFRDKVDVSLLSPDFILRTTEQVTKDTLEKAVDSAVSVPEKVVDKAKDVSKDVKETVTGVIKKIPELPEKVIKK